MKSVLVTGATGNVGSQVVAQLAASGLRVPAGREPVVRSRSEHTQHLQALVTEMQEVARSEAYGVAW